MQKIALCKSDEVEHDCNFSYSESGDERIMVQGPLSKNERGVVVVCACNPSYWGGGGRRLWSKTDLGKSVRLPTEKISKAKRTRCGEHGSGGRVPAYLAQIPVLPKKKERQRQRQREESKEGREGGEREKGKKRSGGSQGRMEEGRKGGREGGREEGRKEGRKES
jgi:hypothetical protein